FGSLVGRNAGIDGGRERVIDGHDREPPWSRARSRHRPGARVARCRRGLPGTDNRQQLLVGQGQQLLLEPGERVVAPDMKRPSRTDTISHEEALACEATPARRLPSAQRQATLAVAGSQTGSRDGYVEGEPLFCKSVWGVMATLLGGWNNRVGHRAA